MKIYKFSKTALPVVALCGCIAESAKSLEFIVAPKHRAAGVVSDHTRDEHNHPEPFTGDPVGQQAIQLPPSVNSHVPMNRHPEFDNLHWFPVYSPIYQRQPVAHLVT